MTVLNWIFIGLLVVDITLIIISIIKNISLMEKICYAAFFPISVVHFPLLLTNYMPDSFHTIISSIIALSFITVAYCCYIFFSFKKPAYFLLGVGILFWCELFRTVFYIYRMPNWAITMIVIIYILLLIATQIFSERKKLSEHLIATLISATSALLSFITLFTLICAPSAKTILLFIGSFINLVIVLLNYINLQKLSIKKGMLIRTIALTASHCLISAACLLTYI
jgi:hypothetical protein